MSVPIPAEKPQADSDPKFTPAELASLAANCSKDHPNERGFRDALRALTIGDRLDARPPGICAGCFSRWTKTGRPRVLVCEHRSAVAIRRRARWFIATGLSAADLASLKGG